MQESLSSEHGSELVTNTLEELLDGGRVADEGRRHLEATWRNGAKSGLNVVGNPLNEVRGVLVLNIAHLVLNLLHGDLTTAINSLETVCKIRIKCDLQDGRASKVATVTEIRSCHHVLWVEHLLRQLWDGNGAERVCATAGERSKANHEEMETREGNHVDSQFAKIRVELTRETEAGSNAGHNGGDQVVEITVGWSVQLQSPHADIIESLVVDTEGLVRVLNQLMD
jgi:hypothetical protein